LQIHIFEGTEQRHFVVFADELPHSVAVVVRFYQRDEVPHQGETHSQGLTVAPEVGRVLGVKHLEEEADCEEWQADQQHG
jgi:hypothetical protein